VAKDDTGVSRKLQDLLPLRHRHLNRPGGYIGLNETFRTDELSAELVERARAFVRNATFHF